MGAMYKFVVTGIFNAGKTTFINTLSDIMAVNTDQATSVTEEKAVKASTTTALDYGQVSLNNNVQVHLFGTPGQQRFDFMRDILAEGMDGYIFLIDSSDLLSLDEAGHLLAGFREHNQTPGLIAANKADLGGPSTDEIRIQLNLTQTDLIMPCVATDKTSVRTVIEQLVALVNAA